MTEGMPQEQHKVIGKGASEKDARSAVKEGLADSIESGAYLRLKMVANEMQDIIDDSSTPEPLRDKLSEIKKNMNLSEEGARNLHLAQMHAERIASRDTLTGLPNRKAFDEAIRVFINHTERFPSDALYTLNIDIDKFKHINDTYGHDAGDRYLQLIAQHVKKVFRPDDIFARTGGDEFSALVIMRSSQGNGTDIKDYNVKALDIVERVKYAVYMAKCELRDMLPTIAPETPPLEVNEQSGNVSVGYAYFELGKDTEETFLKKADKDMYKNKEDGRTDL